MRSRGSTSSKRRSLRFVIAAAALIGSIAVLAAAFLVQRGYGYLVLTDVSGQTEYGRFPVKVGDTFGVGFIHSVNKSPVTDYYEVCRDGIYVRRTVYYGFGAGVQTELEDGQTLTYGEDGSMIISGFDRRMDQLIYIVGTVSDHTLTIGEGEEISLRTLCGRNAKVRFSYRRLFS